MWDKYGGKLHHQWTVSIIKHTDDYTIVYGKPGRKLIHHTNGEVYHCHSHSIEFFPCNLSTQEGTAYKAVKLTYRTAPASCYFQNAPRF